MTDEFNVQCECGTVTLTLTGAPRVRGVCHCEDCRELLKIPFHAVTAWEAGQVAIDAGEDVLIWFQHPTKRMKRVYCSQCGDTLFNTNAMDWRVVSQFLIRKCYGNELPEALEPTKHFFYGRRIFDIDDPLPKQD